ncbi:hypothetical protein BGZ76_005286 [Entomortierella beljakovae]|nr:hypothetical protein BGZ76_005286 [Entomortierella beljakovae]
MHPIGGWFLFYDGKLIQSYIPIQPPSRPSAVYDPNLKSVLIGCNKNERNTFIKILSGNRTLETFKALRDDFIHYKDLLPLFEQAYGTRKTDDEYSKLVGETGGNITFEFGTHSLTETLSEISRVCGEESFSVTQYSFEVEVKKVMKVHPRLGAMHASEFPIVFGSPAVLLTL